MAAQAMGRQLIVFGIAGMLGVQFAFVAAINESNAVLATLLQFLAPIFVVAYVSLSLKKWPPKYQVLGIIGTLIGLFLLLTNASFDSLLISPKALMWGIAVGLTFAFYTLYPARLMKVECAFSSWLGDAGGWLHFRLSKPCLAVHSMGCSSRL